MKVAILYVGIGKYIDFWQGFYLSCEQFFLSNAEKQYFVFTDAPKIPYDSEIKVKTIYQQDMGWPGNTLLRYRFFMRIIEELKTFDYVYFFNGNVLFLTPIEEKEFCPADDRLLVVGHHHYWDKNRFEYSYDRNEKSCAYIPFGEGEYYVCGGINGAKSQKYISFIREMYERIEKDNSIGVVALWHDESHINRYIIDHPDIMLLPPEYCYPELVANPKISGIRRIICRDKRKYFDVYNLKNPEKEIEQLRYDSKRLLIEESQRKVLEKWLYLSCNNIPLSAFFQKRGICSITATIDNDLGILFLNEIKKSNAVSIAKTIRYVQSIGKQTFTNGRSQCLVVTDFFSFSRLYEKIRPYYPGWIISLEDIVNELYENLRDKISFITDDGFPFSLIPRNSKIVLMGAGKIGKDYYQSLLKANQVLVRWIDTNQNSIALFGEMIYALNKIEEKYDFLVLGTSKKEIAKSMTNDLKEKGILDNRVIWFDREISEWVNAIMWVEEKK